MFITTAIEHRGKSSSLISASPLSKAAQKMPTSGNAMHANRPTQWIACGGVVQNFYELTLGLGEDRSSRSPAQVRPLQLSAARESQTIRSHGGDALVPLRINQRRNLFRDEGDLPALTHRSPSRERLPTPGRQDPLCHLRCRGVCESDTTYFQLLNCGCEARAENSTSTPEQLRGDQLIDRVTRGTAFK
jgi:hypothetical protein